MTPSQSDVHPEEPRKRAEAVSSCPDNVKALVWAFIKDTQAGIRDPACEHIPEKLRELQDRFALSASADRAEAASR